ncbi:RICIN domain-containing protein [Streptomyces xanthii]|uniref:RICIN domain-containing protein n=1 Tax=Streptomyces xanthii TaxID=2768069 RepID=A0A7H1B9J4_9ACTN|nr:RICIN domain-containing protein [Streptomyces xanthii]QNS05399.1 RICIN domain-containing protein [Streptomyces xanthii]
MARTRSLVVAAAGLAAACAGLPTPAWAAVPDVPEALRISDGPYAGFQFCGTGTPPAFRADNAFSPLFAASVPTVEPQPGLAGTVELARPDEPAFRSYQVDTGPAGHGWGVQIPTSTFGAGDYRWRIRAENADGPSAWSAWCSFTVTTAETTPRPTEFTYSPDGGRHCLDVAGSGTENATAVQLWDCNGSPGQVWKPASDPGTLVNPHSGKCLDVAGGGTADGTKVQIYACNGTGAQQWRHDTPTPGSLTNPASGKCLDVPYAEFANGVRVQIHACNGTDAQVWKEYAPA